MNTIVSRSTIMIVFALLLIAAVIYINPTLYKAEHKRLEDNMSNLDRRVSSDLVGHKTGLLKQNNKIERDFQAANDTIERALSGIQEELKAINYTNQQHNDHIMTLFGNVDSLSVILDKTLNNQIAISDYIEDALIDIAQWRIVWEEDIDRLSESQNFAIDSLWQFLRDNATWKMKKTFKKTLNP